MSGLTCSQEEEQAGYGQQDWLLDPAGRVGRIDGAECSEVFGVFLH